MDISIALYGQKGKSERQNFCTNLTKYKLKCLYTYFDSSRIMFTAFEVNFEVLKKFPVVVVESDYSVSSISISYRDKEMLRERDKDREIESLTIKLYLSKKPISDKFWPFISKTLRWLKLNGIFIIFMNIRFIE